MFLKLPKKHWIAQKTRIMIEKPTELQTVTWIMEKPKKNHKMG
jgi:hypothetical protein